MFKMTVLGLLIIFAAALSGLVGAQRCDILGRCYNNRPAVKYLYWRARDSYDKFEATLEEYENLCRGWPAVSSCTMDNIRDNFRYNPDYCQPQDERNYQIFLRRVHHVCADFDENYDSYKNNSAEWEGIYNCLFRDLLRYPGSSQDCYDYFNNTEYTLNQQYLDNKITLDNVRTGVCRGFTEYCTCTSREQNDKCGPIAGRIYAQAQMNATQDWANHVGYRRCNVYVPGYLSSDAAGFHPGLSQVCLETDRCYREHGDLVARAMEDRFQISQKMLDTFCNNRQSLSQCLIDKAMKCPSWTGDHSDLLMLHPNYVCANDERKQTYLHYGRCVGRELFQLRQSRSGCYQNHLNDLFSGTYIYVNGSFRAQENYKKQVCQNGREYLDCESKYIRNNCGWHAASFWLDGKISNGNFRRQTQPDTCEYPREEFELHSSGTTSKTGLLSVALMTISSIWILLH